MNAEKAEQYICRSVDDLTNKPEEIYLEGNASCKAVNNPDMVYVVIQ
jgi:hypothetical protein